MSEQATFGGGCFWCLEAVFQRIEGVLEVKPGYAGGDTAEPSYDEVCSGRTGHAEVVQITFDPERISYRDLLEVFWRAHDPTTLNRQGGDVGTQYRSMVLCHNEEQRRQAEDSKAALDGSGVYSVPVVTEIVDLDRFFPAEQYHHDYYNRNPSAGYCRVVIAPKLRKLQLG